MHLRIRIKFIGILLIAAVLPLCVALITAQVLGYRYYRRSQGELFETMAVHIAQTVGISISRDLAVCERWLNHARVGPRLVQSTAPGPDLSTELQALRQDHPLLTRLEIYGLDKRRVAESGVDGIPCTLPGMEVRTVQLEGIHFSTGNCLLLVLMPILDSSQASQPVVGRFKAVLNLGPLFHQLRASMAGRPEVTPIVVGTVGPPIALSAGEPRPLHEVVSGKALGSIRERPAGWTIVGITGPADLVGYAPVELNIPREGSIRTPILALVYNDAAEVMTPVRRQIYMLGGAGTLLVIFCVLAGYYIAGQKIIAPIETLREAAHSVAETAQLGRSGMIAPPLDRSTPEGAVLNRIEKIHTGDEIEELSQEFTSMASRVLSYHHQLEAEIAIKTAAIQGDLQMAKEFQEALMPTHYPRIPAHPVPSGLQLAFHHVYEPTSTVGGDFFDLIKLSDTAAGIFIADVMGHGTRSALITAILRTLLQDLAPDRTDPAEFLNVMNEHFHHLISESHEFLFASAFYLIIDVAKGVARYASAGHPSPLLVERHRNRVSPLMGDLRNDPALGLFRESRYCSHWRKVEAGDLFLLFTDGVFEACNAAGEEFGRERLANSVSNHRTEPMQGMTAAILACVNEFIGHESLADDLCILGVEVLQTPAQVV